MTVSRAFSFVLLASMAVACASCSSSSSSSSGPAATASQHTKLQGAGASFPAPLYDRWFSDYNKAHPDVQVDYQAIGSGGGITQLTNHTVDFAASDAAMTKEEIAKVPEGVVMLPMTAGSIVLAYNLPDFKGELKLSRDVYTGMFLGKIKKWNDPAIAKANPDAKLPELDVTVVRRADSSGTTFVFTQHLAAVNAEWRTGPGVGKSVEWPVGVGAKKNDGVAATIKQTPGAIGYIEFGFVKQAGLPMASLENKAGKFVMASTAAGEAALASGTMSEDMVVWIPDPAGDSSYPIVTYTWLLAYGKYKEPDVAVALHDVLKYCLTDGQKVSEEMGYIPLPKDVVEKVLQGVNAVK